MSVTGLLRKVGYFGMGALCISLTALVFALRVPSSPTGDEAEHVIDGESGSSDRDESPLPRPDDQLPPLKSHAARHPVPAAIELPDVDPFLNTPTELTSQKKLPASTPGEKPAKAGRVNAPVQFDPRETSWENPFTSDCWEGNGWTFDSKGMTSSGSPAAATFRRAYRKLMLEAQIQPLQASSVPLQLRLLASATGSSVAIALRGAELTVTGNSRSADRLNERVALDPPASKEKPGLLRVAATGNRLMFHWNNQVVLTCDQPAAQSGRELLLEWSAGTTPYRISFLRLEGE